MGALDGTHIQASVPVDEDPDMRALHPHKRQDLVGLTAKRLRVMGNLAARQGELWSYGETPHDGSHHVGLRGQTPRSVCCNWNTIAPRLGHWAGLPKGS